MSSKRNILVGVFLSNKAIKEIDKLVRSGLYGKNRAEAIERIVCESLVENKKRR